MTTSATVMGPVGGGAGEGGMMAVLRRQRPQTSQERAGRVGSSLIRFLQAGVAAALQMVKGGRAVSWPGWGCHGPHVAGTHGRGPWACCETPHLEVLLAVGKRKHPRVTKLLSRFSRNMPSEHPDRILAGSAGLSRRLPSK